MADTVSAETRSRMMAGIRSTNTTPELVLRHALHREGLRFRLHRKDLPGTPDLVFPRHRAVLFAHGCFWHGHNCPLFKWPSTRPEFWQAKITRNRHADERAEASLAQLGWRIGIVWECTIRGRGRIPMETVIRRCRSWILSRAGRFEIRGKH